jgi:hypothetical protein
MNRRRSAAVAAGVLVVALPTMAFFLAPTAHADDSPGANLAGINASAVAQAALVQPLTPGLVGAGNLAQGNLFEVAMPYASSSSSTGPSSTGVASPVYPGPTAAQLGTVLSTFQPIPATLQSALDDPAVAQSDYPPQVGTGSSSTYAPPGGSTTGVGTASSSASDSGATSTAATSDTVLPASMLEIASSTATATTEVQASSVQATAHTDVGTIKLLGGLVTIAGLSSDATAASDGNNGEPTGNLQIGAVTVAGQAAYIGPDGLHLSSSSQLGTLVPVLNQVLTALAQAGLSVRTLAPTLTTDGTSAEVTSGALQIEFVDPHIPNPNGMVPVSSVGFDLDLGLSQASADATALPPIPPFGSSGPTASGTGGMGAAASAPAAVSAAGAPSAPTSAGSGSQPSTAEPSGGPGPVLGAGPTPARAPLPAAASGPRAASTLIEPAGFFGLPIRASWVVVACLLSVVAAGPLLAYANWQLLRGRKT